VLGSDARDVLSGLGAGKDGVVGLRFGHQPMVRSQSERGRPRTPPGIQTTRCPGAFQCG
jgi:hypothetical protein